jgi:hypothetical protein
VEAFREAPACTRWRCGVEAGVEEEQVHHRGGVGRSHAGRPSALGVRSLRWHLGEVEQLSAVEEELASRGD